MKKIVGIFLAIVSLGLIGFGVYSLLFSPKTLMLTYMQKELSTVKNLSQEENITKEKISTTGSLKMSEEEISVKGDTYLDNENLKYYLNYIVNYMNADIPLQVYFENNKLYYKFLDQFNYFELSENNNESNITKEELNELGNILNESLKDDLDNKLFSKTNSSITVNNSSIKADKYSLKFTTQDFYNYLNKLLTRIDSNTKISNIKKMLFKTKSKTEILNSFKTNVVDEIGKDKDFIEYSIFVSNNEIVRNELKTIDKENTLSIILDSYNKGNNKYKYELSINEKDSVLVSGFYDEQDNNSTFKLTVDSYIVDGSINKSDNSETLTASLYEKTAPNKILGKLTISEKEITKNSEYETNITISIPDLDTTLTLNNKVKFNEEVPKFDTTGAKRQELDQSSLNSLL
ncbi:MAG: hypothetical protein PUD59_00760 [bacterium]|nr:hypothetical protein [bacterium]